MNRHTFGGSSDGPRTLGGAGEVRDPLDHFLGRLTELGATPEEVAQVALHWYVDADDWDDEARSKLLHSSDGVLVAHIRQVRAEWEEVRPDAAR